MTTTVNGFTCHSIVGQTDSYTVCHWNGKKPIATVKPILDKVDEVYSPPIEDLDCGMTGNPIYGNPIYPCRNR